MNDRPYYKEIVTTLVTQIEEIEERHRANTDIVMGDVLFESMWKREKELKKYAKDSPERFAQLIADGDIRHNYISYLSTDKYKIHPINLGVVPILEQSSIEEVTRNVSWYKGHAIKAANKKRRWFR